MQVVLFCGGFGMRLREYSDLPKPLITVGEHPILWHLMHYYAHYGHCEFILCLGYKAQAFERFFLTCGAEVVSNCVLGPGARQIRLAHDDMPEWTITFVDTGLQANIGQRLKAVEPYVHDDVFLANYADGLTDLYLPQLIDFFHSRGTVATFVCVRPPQTFHVVAADTQGWVNGLYDVKQSSLWVNGGYFVFKRAIFEYIGIGEELIDEPFHRLMNEHNLVTYKYEGFWACMDTFKEKQQLDELCGSGGGPWEVWRSRREPSPDHTVFVQPLPTEINACY